MARTTVSILNWNNSAATNKCLLSIADISRDQQPDVVVVDNDSRREELSIDPAIKAKLKSLAVIRNRENLGFANGHNAAIRTAKEKNCDYIVLLNNDTQVTDKQLFGKLTEALEYNQAALAANPTIFSHMAPKTIWYGGGKMSFITGSVRHLRVGRLDAPTGVMTTGFLTGGCLAISLKRADLHQLLLSDDYFLYWEDADWSARARRAGFELLYVADAQVLHNVSSALGVRSPFYIYYNIRNHLLFVRRHVRVIFWPLAVANLAFITGKYKFNILFRYKRGRWQALKALWSGWRDGLAGKAGQTREIV